jgi:hypothetical protein
MPAMSSRDKYINDVASRIASGDPIKQEEIIDTPVGRMEKWRADSILIGVTSGVEECLRATQTRFDQVRADTAGFVNTLKDREQQVSAREDAVSTRERAVLDLVGGASKLLDRLERHRADAEKFAEEPALPPGEEPPTSDEEMQPTGHLHEVPAKEEPELEGTEDEELPPELAKLEPEKPPEPRGSVFPQPTAISLNSEEED